MEAVEKLQFLEHCHDYNNTPTLTDVVSRLTCYKVQCESATAVSNTEPRHNSKSHKA
jgi:hypothetical protein